MKHGIVHWGKNITRQTRWFQTTVVRTTLRRHTKKGTDVWRKLYDQRVRDLFYSPTHSRWNLQGVQNESDVWETHTKFWSEKSEKRDPLRDLGVDGKMALAWGLQKQSGRVWTGIHWLRIRTNALILDNATTCHKTRHRCTSRLAERLLDSQGGLCPMELVQLRSAAVSLILWT